MKEAIKVILIVSLAVAIFLAIIWVSIWAFSVSESSKCVKVPYYAYSVKGFDKSAGSDLEIAKELANGRDIYVSGEFCE